MKATVIYFTKTGHSRKLANAIATELQTKALDISKNPSLEPTECLYIVGGIYGGQSLPEMLEYVKAIKPKVTTNVVLVTSSVGNQQKQTEVAKILEENGIMVIEELLCQGSFLFFKMGHPNKKDIADLINQIKQ